MVTPELSAIFFGLASAASWGAGDFSGGVATKRSSVYAVVIISQLVGALCLIAVALVLREPSPLVVDLLVGALAGLAGALGLMALYRGLALGRMGIVAPVAAVVTAIMPVLFGLVTEGLPALQQLFGFVLALTAVWLISRPGGKFHVQPRDLILPVGAGLGFGLFFILIDRISPGAVLWPLAAARFASIGMLLAMASLARQRITPTLPQLPVIALAGIFDTGGNAFFVLAAQAGRLDIAAVIASLYPASTILLAWLILKERLLPQQWFGVVAALIAVGLISV